MTPALFIFVLYLISLGCLILWQKQSEQLSMPSETSVTSKLQPTLFWLSLLTGIAVHFFFAANTSYVQHSFNFSVSSMTLWFSALVVATFAVGSLLYPIKNLAVVVLPIAILCILFALVWGDKPQIISHKGTVFYWHIGTASLAFTLLSLAVLQALLFGYQELALRKQSKNLVVHWLPAIQTMEEVLFKLVLLGFILLSLSISLGSLYNFQLNQSLLSFNHHSVLAILSWLSFAVLVYGRLKLGWLGMQVIYWILAAFALLALGYFGTKIIYELVNL